MGDCRVYNKALFQDLMQSSDQVTQSGVVKKKVKKITAAERDRARASVRHKQHSEAQDRRNAEEQNRFREMVESAKARRDAEFERQFEKLQKGHKFVDSIDKFLQMTEQSAKQKTEKLHLEWEHEVFSRVQRAVANNLETVNRDELNKIKRDEFQKFLSLANSKAGGLFLDSAGAPGDVPAPKIAAAKIGRLKDPSRRVLDKALEEQCIFDLGGGKATAALKEDPKNRDVLEITQWAAGKIEATPHGHFSKMMSGKPRMAGSKSSQVNKSNITMDHYDVYQGRANEHKGGLKPVPGNGNHHAPLWSDAWGHDSYANKVNQKIGRSAPPNQRPEAAIVNAQPVCGRSNQQNQQR